MRCARKLTRKIICVEEIYKFLRFPKYKIQRELIYNYHSIKTFDNLFVFVTTFFTPSKKRVGFIKKKIKIDYSDFLSNYYSFKDF